MPENLIKSHPTFYKFLWRKFNVSLTVVFKTTRQSSIIRSFLQIRRWLIGWKICHFFYSAEIFAYWGNGWKSSKRCITFMYGFVWNASRNWRIHNKGHKFLSRKRYFLFKIFYVPNHLLHMKFYIYILIESLSNF